jgi:beta-glucosidase
MTEGANVISLPDDLLLGCSTSATQIEGGDVRHSWSRHCEGRGVADGSHPKDAGGHWERVAEDVDLLARMNQQTYRMSIEWARVEPERGRWDEAAFERYREELGLLRDKGVVPLVTLHHFTNPTWVDDAGGWENRDVLDAFLAYVDAVLDRLGDLVTDWVTVNEPTVYAYHGYIDRSWPPARRKRHLRGFRLSTRNMLRAHIRSHKRIHEVHRAKGWSPEPRVGIALNFMAFRPSRHAPKRDRLASWLAEQLFQDGPSMAAAIGHFLPPYGFPHRYNNFPEGSGDFTDFVGVSYDRAFRARFSAGGRIVERSDASASTSDMGWEIDAEGLYRVCADCHESLGKPIFITGNGVAANDDATRSRFIHDHLAQVVAAKSAGIPIERYYHRSFLDGFEWDAGMSAKVGLVGVDSQTGERTVKPSGEYYADICASRALTSPTSAARAHGE